MNCAGRAFHRGNHDDPQSRVRHPARLPAFPAFARRGRSGEGTSGGVVADETAKDGRAATVQLFNAASPRRCTCRSASPNERAAAPDPPAEPHFDLDCRIPRPITRRAPPWRMDP